MRSTPTPSFVRLAAILALSSSLSSAQESPVARGAAEGEAVVSKPIPGWQPLPAANSPEWVERKKWFVDYCREHAIDLPATSLGKDEGDVPLKEWQAYLETYAPFIDVMRWGIPPRDKQAEYGKLFDLSRKAMTASREGRLDERTRYSNLYSDKLIEVFGERVGLDGVGGTKSGDGTPARRWIWWIRHPSQRGQGERLETLPEPPVRRKG